MSSSDLVKNDGGVVALAEKPAALKCWVINELQTTQMTFKKAVMVLVHVFEYKVSI